MALATVVWQMVWVVGSDTHRSDYYPGWSLFSLATGPLIFFYVLRLTQPDYIFRLKHLLHFGPLLLVLVMEISEVSNGIKTIAIYYTSFFQRLPILLQLLTILSLIIYFYWSHRLIERFYHEQQLNGVDRYRYEFRWLHNLVLRFGWLLLVWLSLEVISYYKLGREASYFSYLLLAVLTIWIAAVAHSRSGTVMETDTPSFLKPPLPVELRQKASRLKTAMREGGHYKDPELTLSSLAQKLNLSPHELSRIINTALKKKFNDFVNEYRVAEVIKKMQEPANDNITLVGIATDSGFNSKSTFNRIFKEMTGKSPAEYKADDKKKLPTYNMGRQTGQHPGYTAVISGHNATTELRQALKISNWIFMFKTFFKTAVRTMLRNKTFTFINTLGLAAGLTTCLLIVFYVKDELGYDKYNVKADRIYRADVEVKFGNNANTYSAAAAPVGGEMKKDFPEVEEVARLRAAFEQPAGFVVKKGNTAFIENNVIYADASLFAVFTFPIIEGNPRTALALPNSVVITESTAKKYFNSTKVIGQTLIFNDTSQYKITGVIKDIPRQSHFRYDIFISMETEPDSRDNGWGGGGFNTYILLKPGAVAIQPLETKISSLAMQKNSDWLGKGDYVRITLRPLTSIHLHSNVQQELGHNNSIQYVYIFSAIAVFILLIACVNFMNLSTARSSNRAREVGVRKVLGSPRNNLIAQFLTESLLVTLVATAAAIIMAWLLLPLFNQVSGKELAFTRQTFTWLAPAAIILVIIVSLIAGAYPAFFLSAFRPVDVLRGKLSTGFKGRSLRSMLVVFQFSISIFLIIGTMIIYNQLHFIQSRNLGYNREQVLIIKNTDVLKTGAKILKQELQELPGISGATMSLYLPTGGRSLPTALFPNTAFISKESMLTEFWPVDADYVKTLGMQIISGRDFLSNMQTDSSAIIINEAAAKFLGWSDPLNKTVYTDSYSVEPNRAFHIVGVIKDFHFKSLRENITPVVFYLKEDRRALNVKISSTDITNTMQEIKKKWKALAPNQQLEYSFMDADFEAAFRAESRIGTVFIAFTILAICIACLGLFGLVAYAAKQRIKEVGIRKVLGADVPTLVGLLSKDFIVLVFISIIIASPLAWLAMHKWLQGYSYRTTISWITFAASAVLAILIALMTTSFHAIKAAVANPVKSLRTE